MNKPYRSIHPFVLCLAAPAILLAQTDRIPGAIDNRQTVAARGIVHSLAQPRYDQGPVEASFRLSYIQMMLAPAAARKAALDQLLAAQQDPASPDFRHWLTPEQYADRFGVSAGDLAKIAQWLRSAGFSIDYTARARNWIAFSGTAAQVEAAFHTTVHRYFVNGENHFAISSDPSVPAAIAPLLATFAGLNDFYPQPRIVPANTSIGGSFGGSLAPGDLAIIYDINPLYQQGIDGAGQSVVIVGASDIALADIQTFRTTYGLSAANVQTVLVGPDPGTDKLAQEEADLDLEWAGAIARGAKLIYVYGNNADSAAIYAIDQNLAPVISESFGTCETEVPTSVAEAFQTIAQQANSQGITWVVASGDAGAATCDSDNAAASQGVTVSFPASIPEVTAVGGTEFNEGRANYWNSSSGANGGSAAGYIPEMAWNDGVYGAGHRSGLCASGGGGSVLFSKPTWQTGPGVPADNKRDLPDIAFPASADHDPYNVEVAGQAQFVGGTSASTPVFAGVLTLLNQYLKGNGLGNINASLYPLAASSPGIFHDVTAGNNIVPCKTGTPDCAGNQLGYNATPGFDLVTGLGSIDVYNLVSLWKGAPAGSVTALKLSPSSVAAGSATFTLTVTGSNFASAAVIEWNGTALPTTFVSSGQVTANVSASLIASAGTAAITVSSGATATGPLYFTAVAPPLAYSGSRMMSQAAISSGIDTPPGCAASPAVTFFATNMTAYLFFYANLSGNDQVSAWWLAPDGTAAPSRSSTASQSNGTWCLSFTGPSFGNLTATQLGTWTARVYDNGTLLFSIQFTVTCTVATPPLISSINSASAYGDYSYFASGSWLEIKGINLADPADPRLTAATDPGQWTANDFNGSNAPTMLDGINVSINGKPAYVWYLSTGQLNVQAPEDSTVGNVSVTVTTCKGTSSPVMAMRQALAPGLLAPPQFMVNGTQYVVAQFASDYAYVLNTSAGTALGVKSRPARPGDLIIAYGIGFGDVTPSILPGVTVGQGNALVNPVTFSFGSANAAISYAGLAGNFIGLYEFYITVPSGLADGDYQINVTQNGTKLPQTMYLTVHN